MWSIKKHDGETLRTYGGLPEVGTMSLFIYIQKLMPSKVDEYDRLRIVVLNIRNKIFVESVFFSLLLKKCMKFP